MILCVRCLVARVVSISKYLQSYIWHAVDWLETKLMYLSTSCSCFRLAVAWMITVYTGWTNYRRYTSGFSDSVQYAYQIRLISSLVKFPLPPTDLNTHAFLKQKVQTRKERVALLSASLSTILKDTLPQASSGEQQDERSTPDLWTSSCSLPPEV